MANLPGDGLIELIVKRYPGGRFSGLLDGGIGVGDRLSFTGPYGSLRVRESERPILMVAGGSGMAPILSLLRELARVGAQRPIRFFYGARTEDDVFYADLAAGLADFTPRSSAVSSTRPWTRISRRTRISPTSTCADRRR